MSTSPPPPFPPTQPAGPSAPAAPPWQATGTLSPPPPSPASPSRLPIIIIAVVVVIAIAVVLFVVLGGDDEQASDEGIDAAAAHDGLAVVIEDASFDENGNDDFRSCPLGDVDDLIALVGTVVDLDDDVVEGVEQMGAVEETGDFPPFVSCQMYAEDEVRRGADQVFFQAVLDPPRDYEEYITEFSGDITDVTFEDSEEYLGGEIVIFCAEAVTDAGYTGCDADWVDSDNDIALNLFLGGADADKDEAVEALKLVLPVMADNLASHVRTESES